MAEKASDETVVQAPAATIMDIIIDYERYPEWAANIEQVEIRATDDQGRGTRVWYQVDVKVMELEYVLGYEYDENRVTWHLVEADQLKQLNGEYMLTEEDGSTRVHYTLEVDLAVPLPGFLKERAAKQILETGLGDLKRRAESMA